MEIEGLLKKIEQLAPRLGRARDDLAALVSRGRAGDYKGVMQNSRLVLEMLLRSLVTTELKQTPGKAMLDELVSKFRQQANAGVVPTNILAHMGTVQAWGNLSSHDQAGGLHEEGVRVGPEEVVTSLNSMVAILTWYAGKYAAPHGTPAPEAGSKGGKWPRVAIAAVLVVALGAGASLLLERGPDPADARRRLDETYAGAREPPPPPACRSNDAKLLDALARAAKAADPVAALGAVGAPASAEHHFLIARAKLQAGQRADAELAEATRCAGFAAAENLAGNAAVKAKRLDEAEARYREAIELAPEFAKARFNLGVLKLQQSKVAEAIGLLEAAVAKDSGDGDAHFFLGMAHEALARAAKDRGDGAAAEEETAIARAAYCKALELGNALAKDRCQP